jgi:hypothetical protein
MKCSHAFPFSGTLLLSEEETYPSRMYKDVNSVAYVIGLIIMQNLLLSGFIYARALGHLLSSYRFNRVLIGSFL